MNTKLKQNILLQHQKRPDNMSTQLKEMRIAITYNATTSFLISKAYGNSFILNCAFSVFIVFYLCIIWIIPELIEPLNPD
jgi:hypothetical protein